MSPLSKEVTTDEAVSGPRVRHFTGRLGDITDEVRQQRRDASKTSTWLLFDFDQLEILEATEPYTFPTFRIEVLEINIPKTPWEVMKRSIRDCGYEGPISGLIGLKCELRYAEAVLSMGKRDGEGFEDREAYCWQFVNIEGVENTSEQLLDWVINTADGKTGAAFKAAYLTENSIRTMTNYGEVTNQVMGDILLPSLVTGSKLTVDENGIYHKVV